MELFLSGAMVAAYAVAGLFFVRFWRASKDRLFLFFAVAFWLLGLQRLGLTVDSNPADDTLWFPLLRLVGFLLILAAIVDKNRGTSRAGGIFNP